MRKKIILFIALLVLIPSALFFITTRHSATASLNFITKWGFFDSYSTGPQNGQFVNPQDIALDSARGFIYVIDWGNCRVQKFRIADGSYVLKFGSDGSGDGQFAYCDSGMGPQGIAVDPSSGDVYVGDTWNNRVERFSGTDGSYSGQWSTTSPSGIAVDPTSGDIYVSQTYSNDIQRFASSDYHLISTTTLSLSTNSQVFSIAVDSSGNLYAASALFDWDTRTYSGKVVEVKTDTTQVQWDAPYPMVGIAVDSSGNNIYVTTQGGSGLYEYDNSGNPENQSLTLVLGGSDYGQFSNPVGIAVDDSGIYIVDSGNNRVQRLKASDWSYDSFELGYVLPADGGFSGPQGIAVDALNNVYVVDSANSRIQEFDNSGTYLAQWGTPGAEDNQFTNPSSIAIGPSPGNIYVTDSGNNRVEEFDSSGHFVRAWGTQGTGSLQLNNPQGIVVDSLGHVYVVDTGNNRIQEFSSDGQTLVGQWGGSGSIAGKFNSPVGITIDSSGNIYITDTGNSRVQKFNSSHAYTGQWSISNTIAGIGVDSSGNVYVSDTSNNTVSEYSNSGAFISSIGVSGNGNGQFNSPSGLALDSSGNLFVVDSGNNRVQEFGINLDLGVYVSDADTNFYRGDNNVFALAKASNILYLGGSFGLEAVDDSTGQKIDWTPDLPSGTNTVYSLAYSAANNILYVGTDNGLFEYDTSNSTGTLVADFAPMSNQESSSTVYALQIVGNTLYVGGSFSYLNNGMDQRLNLASFDISTPTAVLTPWQDGDTDGASGQVNAFAASDTTLYVGGGFYNVNGDAHPAIAAFDLTSGNLVNAFDPFGNTEDQSVYALAYSNGKLYAGGSIALANGHAFNNLLSLNTTTGDLITSWVPSPPNKVFALAVEGNYLYVGGGFGVEGGGVGFAQGYSMQSGNLVDWYPQSTQSVYALFATDPALYAGLHINPLTTLAKPNKIFAVKNNVNRFDIIPVAQAAEMGNLNGNLLADIGGLPGTIYLAKFDIIPVPTATPTLVPTDTPTPTPGSTSSSAPVCSDQKPGIPTNPTVVAGPGAGQATLSWTAPTGPVTDYSIVYSNDPTVKKWGVVSTGNVTTYVISNLPLNQNYYFWINAVNGCMPGDPIDPEIELLANGASASSIPATASASNSTTGITAQTSTIPPLSPLPPTGPVDTIKIGVAGVIITIIGGALLLAL